MIERDIELIILINECSEGDLGCSLLLLGLARRSMSFHLLGRGRSQCYFPLNIRLFGLGNDPRWVGLAISNKYGLTLSLVDR